MVQVTTTKQVSSLNDIYMKKGVLWSSLTLMALGWASAVMSGQQWSHFLWLYLHLATCAPWQWHPAAAFHVLRSCHFGGQCPSPEQRKMAPNPFQGDSLSAWGGSNQKCMLPNNSFVIHSPRRRFIAPSESVWVPYCRCAMVVGTEPWQVIVLISLLSTDILDIITSSAWREIQDVLVLSNFFLLLDSDNSKVLK
jgi:hypothetical protein